MHNVIKIVVFVMLFAAVSGAQEKKRTYDRWNLLAPLPANELRTAVAELDGKIYVIGGYPADRKTLSTVQMYDSATDKWQIVAPLPVPLNHVMAAATNGKVYAIDMRPAKEYQQSPFQARARYRWQKWQIVSAKFRKAAASCFIATAKPMISLIARCSLSIVVIETSSLCRRDTKVGSNAATAWPPVGAKGKQL